MATFSSGKLVGGLATRASQTVPLGAQPPVGKQSGGLATLFYVCPSGKSTTIFPSGEPRVPISGPRMR